MPIHGIEEARLILQWAAERSSVRALAREGRLNHKSLANFLSGATVKPRPEVLPGILELAELHAGAFKRWMTRIGPPAPGYISEYSDEGHAASSDAGALSSYEVGRQVGRWAGRLEEALAMHQAVADRMAALLSDMRSPGAWSPESPAPTPLPGAAGKPARDLTAEEFAEEMERRGFPRPVLAPAPRPAAR
jgi:hypothetical protein